MHCNFRTSTFQAAIGGALFLAPAVASAQFVYDDSHNAFPAGSAVEFAVGVSNGPNTPDYTFRDSSAANGSANLSASGNQQDTNYGATHQGVGSASLTNLSNAGGISLTGSFAAQDTLLTPGGNSFFSGIAFGEFGVDEGFTVTATGDYTFLASGTRSNAAYASPYGDGTSYFQVTLQDRTTSAYLLNSTIDYRDESGGPYNPLNSTVHLVAGEYYELNAGAYDLVSVGYPDSPGQSSMLDYSYELQIGSPAAVPESPGFLAISGLLGWVGLRWRSARQSR